MSTRLRVVAAAALIGALAAANLAAQDVAIEELRRNFSGDLDWVNFTGTPERIDTAAAIRGIGTELALTLAAGGGTGSYGSGYRIIRAVDPALAVGLDADILALDQTAQVNHIDNLRRIISGYAQSAFDYPANDADTLAVFATVYNALFRGDMEYFGTAYKPVVIDHLTPDNAGLSLRYTEWPGATRLLLPLRAVGGVAGAVSANELSDDTVIEQLRQDEDRGLDVRKDMVDLREQEVDETGDALADQRQDLTEQQQQLDAEQERLDSAQAEADAQRQAATTEEERRQAEQRQQELAAEQQQLQERGDELSQQDQQLAAREQALQDDQQSIDRERASIVADEQERATATQAETATGRATASVSRDRVYYLTTRDIAQSGYFTTQLATIDPQSGALSALSDVGHIAQRSFAFFGEQIVAIAHRAGALSPTTLTLLDPADLSLVQRGEHEVYRQSHLFLQGGSVYAVVATAGDFRVGRFDEQLQLIAQSDQSVEPRTYLARFGDQLFADAGDAVLILDAADLTLVGRFDR